MLKITKVSSTFDLELTWSNYEKTNYKEKIIETKLMSLSQQISCLKVLNFFKFKNFSIKFCSFICFLYLILKTTKIFYLINIYKPS